MSEDSQLYEDYSEDESISIYSVPILFLKADPGFL